MMLEETGEGRMLVEPRPGAAGCAVPAQYGALAMEHDGLHGGAHPHHRKTAIKATLGGATALFLVAVVGASSSLHVSRVPRGKKLSTASKRHP